jgi:amino acid permease
MDWVIPKAMEPFPRDWVRVSSVVPNLMLALSYQMNFFPIYKGLKNSCDDKMGKASLVAICSCGFSYLLVGMLGYALYG